MATLAQVKDPNRTKGGERGWRSNYALPLLALFFLSLPLVNPWVRGDGIGYYAYIHSLLIHHNLNFEDEFRAGNTGFTMSRVDANGNLDSSLYTTTGHLGNHFTVGPSMLWAPLLVPVHGVMLALQRAGFHVKPDGFSKPYIVAMAVATALYGFIGLLLCYSIACRFVDRRWAFLATLGIWFASSLPVYMYFNPSWSHAHSVFAVSLFLWFWERTRRNRTLVQWIILGLLSGLMLDMYYPNVVVLIIPLFESLRGYWRSLRPGSDWNAVGRLFGLNTLYCASTVLAFLPTLITRNMIYGHFLTFGYDGETAWRWASPVLGAVLLSSDHGLLTWTPVLIPALVGLVLFWKYDRELAPSVLVVVTTFCYLIACYICWDGLSSFGNRFFISMTPFFVLGLSITLNELAIWMKSRQAAMRMAVPVISFLILWNWAFIFQWGMHLIPVRGPISWRTMVANQFVVVPEEIVSHTRSYFGNRRALMQHIEQLDIKQMQARQNGAGR